MAAEQRAAAAAAAAACLGALRYGIGCNILVDRSLHLYLCRVSDKRGALNGSFCSFIPKFRAILGAQSRQLMFVNMWLRIQT